MKAGISAQVEDGPGVFVDEPCLPVTFSRQVSLRRILRYEKSLIEDLPSPYVRESMEQLGGTTGIIARPKSGMGFFYL